MKTKIVEIFTLVLAMGFGGMARADIVELDLFNLGCPTEFNWDSLYWQTNFDIGFAFTEISNVYIDWSGDITAGLAVRWNPKTFENSEPFPLEVGVYASLGFNPHLRRTTIWGGEGTYPDPQPFDYLSQIGPSGTASWSDLLDGKGTITIAYTELIILNGWYVESGSITLDSATLMVNGTIVPEPASILLVGMGTLVLRAKYLIRRFKS